MTSLRGLRHAGSLMIGGLSAALKTVDAVLGFPNSASVGERQRQRLVDLERLNRLHRDGALTDAELTAEKNRLLGGSH